MHNPPKCTRYVPCYKWEEGRKEEGKKVGKKKRHLAKCFLYFYHPPHLPTYVIILQIILYTRKLKLRVIELLAQCHTDCKK